MFPWTAVIGAAMGAQRAKNQDVENNKQRQTEITREMWSPWTGRLGKDVKAADHLGSVMQGFSAGLAMGQGMGGGMGGQAAAAAPQMAPGGGQNLYATQPINATAVPPRQVAPQNQYEMWKSGNTNLYTA